MSFKVIETTLAAAVATSETITFSYPDGYDAGSFYGARGHKLNVRDLQTVFESPDDFTVAFGANIVVTYNGATTIPSGSLVQLQAEMLGSNDGNPKPDADAKRFALAPAILINLGAPIAADPNGVCESQAVNADTDASLDGALVSGGEGVFDVPRNVVAAWTNAAVITVTGEDEYGNVVVEQGASGTSFTGKKAFKKVTSVQFSANVTAATVGTGDVLGLPVFLPKTGLVLKELENGAAATTGTLVAGATAKATATTGDVRGTYDPNSAADGSKVFQLVAAIPDPTDYGVDQYAG